MVKYLKGVTEEFPKEIVGKLAVPAEKRLFDILDKKDAKPLEEERVVIFHHTTAQIFSWQRGHVWAYKLLLFF